MTQEDPPRDEAELERLAPQRIYVLGGTASVNNNVQGVLDSYTTGPVIRLAGADRYATVPSSRARSGRERFFRGRGPDLP